MPAATGGRMVQRAPNDPAWYKGGLFHDDQFLNVPGLWFMSWYDVSVGPNVAMYNHVRKTAQGKGKDNQWMVIAPVAHCSYTRASEHTVVGQRDMGDARLGYQDLVYDFFDQFLAGRASQKMILCDPQIAGHFFVLLRIAVELAVDADASQGSRSRGQDDRRHAQPMGEGDSCGERRVQAHSVNCSGEHSERQQRISEMKARDEAHDNAESEQE